MIEKHKIMKHSANFIKPCPGTPGYVCCGYKIIDFARGCNLGCTYCILKLYNYKGITLFKNVQKLFYEVETYLENQKGFTRFGTGEFTDSLLFEDAYSIYRHLIPIISSAPNAVLEIKTKTTNIANLLKIKEHKNIIVSWSLNSEYISRNEEKGAPGIEERLRAARRVQEHGYRLAFHFDPIILHRGWEEGYKRTIDRLFLSVKSEHIAYISLGTLRFVPEMYPFIEKMRDDCRKGEFIRGSDGKIRYFRPLRTAAYRAAKLHLSHHVDEQIIYLCMENPTVWEDVFGIGDMNDRKLKERLDEACRKSFTLP